MNDFWKLPKAERKRVAAEKRRLQFAINSQKYHVNDLEFRLKTFRNNLAENQRVYEKLCKEYNLPL